MPSATLGYSLTAASLPSPVSRSQIVIYKDEGGAGRLELTGAGTYAIDLAMMPTAGLKGMRVEVDAVDAAGAAVTAPITVGWTSNGVTKAEELSPGGFFVLCSPTPTHGVTALSITYTANAVVRVFAVG